MAELKKTKKFKGIKVSKKLQYGAYASVFTIAVIVFVILLNSLTSALTEKYNLNADMTSDRRYDISQNTIDLLSSINNKMSIYMLSTEVDAEEGLGIYGPSIVSILKRYNVLSNGMINVEFIDIERNPTFTQGYDLGEISQFSILVRSDAAYKLLTFNDYLYYRAADSYSEPEAVGLDIEHALASAITYCDTGAKRNAVLLTGKGEEAGTKLISFLESNNFNITYMNLATETLPEDTDLIIINSPEKDYSVDEISQIDVFLNEKLGKLIISMGTESEAALNLQYYLKQYGVTYTDEAVFDSSNALTGHPESVVAASTGVDTISRLSEKSTMIIMPNSLKMTYTDVSGNGWTREDLLTSMSTSFTKKNDLERDPLTVTADPSDPVGASNLATVLTRVPLIDKEGDETAGKILVLSSGEALNDTYLNSGSYSNWSFMSMLLGDFFGGDDLSAFSYKLFDNSDLVTLESDQQMILIVLIAIPVILLLGGAFVWAKRKNM